MLRLFQPTQPGDCSCGTLRAPILGYLTPSTIHGNCLLHTTPPGGEVVHHTAQPEHSVRSLVVPMHDNVVDFEDHLHDLRRQEQLLLLTDERLEDKLLLHVVRPGVLAVDPEVRVVFGHLPVRADVREGADAWASARAGCMCACGLARPGPFLQSILVRVQVDLT